jgi:hypothetical protein
MTIAKKVLTPGGTASGDSAVACERFCSGGARYYLIPIKLGAKATVGALRGGLRVPRPRQFWTRRRVAWYSLFLFD